MTRLIFVFALLLAPGLTRANPDPSPSPKMRKTLTRVDQTSIRRFSTPTPIPASKPKGEHQGVVSGSSTKPSSRSSTSDAQPTGPTFGPNVGRGTNAPRTGNAYSVPNAGPSRVIVNPGGAPERVYTPGAFLEPPSPAMGPGYRTGSSTPSNKTKSQSNVVSSTATRKVPEKVLIPPLPKNSDAAEEAGAETNIDANPPAPGELGAPIVIPMIPRYDAVPRSKALFLPSGNVPVPVSYTPPGADAPREISPTSLRAWNGEMTRETRTFDQTRVEVSTDADGARRWQFFWRTSGAKPRAARWEISTAPFVDDANHFPPAGLIAYGDASINASSPTLENFFSVEFNSLAKNLGNTSAPSQLYLRVVPVDAGGNPAAQPSNWIRVDIR